MSEHTPLVRQWILLRKLAASHFGCAVRDLAHELGTSVKTIRRDLESFQTAGFPLVEETHDHGKKVWRLDGDKNAPALMFNYDEAFSLYLGRRFLEPLAGTPFWQATKEAFAKIHAMLGPTAAKYVDRMSDSVCRTQGGNSDYGKKSDIIDALMLGIDESHAVFVTYQSLQATEPVTYDLYPLGLVYHRGSLYLVGVAPADGKIRHWKIDRMLEAEATEVPFHRPKDFSLEAHLRKSFGIFQGDGDIRAVVRFSATVARYVEESHWHPSQQLAPQRDGSVVAEFQLTTTEEFKQWILSFSRHATVLEPASLRDEIRADLAAMTAAYDDGASTPPRARRKRRRPVPGRPPRG